jgi:iron complex outermembrane receptor protein
MTKEKNPGLILLVEDRPDETELMKQALHQAGVDNPIRVLTDGADAIAYFEGSGRYTSRLPVNDANSFHSPESTVVDARAGVGALRLGALGLEPYAGVTNLLDEEYNTSVVINAFGRRFYEPGPSRSFYVGASVRLGRD